MINWVYFPKSSPPPEFGLRLVALSSGDTQNRPMRDT